MSWKPEVIADNSGKWCGNGLAFETKEESDSYAFDLSMRWTLVRETRSVESNEPVNYVWQDGRAIRKDDIATIPFTDGST